jgi:hypothetical protein
MTIVSGVFFTDCSVSDGIALSFSVLISFFFSITTVFRLCFVGLGSMKLVSYPSSYPLLSSSTTGGSTFSLFLLPADFFTGSMLMVDFSFSIAIALFSLFLVVAYSARVHFSALSVKYTWTLLVQSSSLHLPGIT